MAKTGLVYHTNNADPKPTRPTNGNGRLSAQTRTQTKKHKEMHTSIMLYPWCMLFRRLWVTTLSLSMASASTGNLATCPSSSALCKALGEMISLATLSHCYSSTLADSMQSGKKYKSRFRTSLNKPLVILVVQNFASTY